MLTPSGATYSSSPRSVLRRWPALRPTLCAMAILAACTLDPGGEETDAAVNPTSESPTPTATATTPTPVAPGPPAQPTAGGDSQFPIGGGADIPALVRQTEPSVVAVVHDLGEGSGIIYDASGLIVTNLHVVRDATNIDVQLATGERLPAELTATDATTDVALLQIERDNLPAATFAEELPEVGELAIAIGNPVGLENTVTAGIISGLGRSVPSGPVTPQPLVDLIQTDAPISPGNSGGALVNAEGEVVGMNIAYLPPQQTGAVAIGFAIPAATVSDVVEQLRATGTVERAFVGIQTSNITQQIAERFDLDVEQGVLVLQVVPDSPASDGLLAGDVLTSLNGDPLREVADLYTALRGLSAGDVATFGLIRDGEELQVDVTLAERPQS